MALSASCDRLPYEMSMTLTRSPTTVISASRVSAFIASTHWCSVQALLIARRNALYDIDPVPRFGSVCRMAVPKPDTVRIVRRSFIMTFLPVRDGCPICSQCCRVAGGPCDPQFSITFRIIYIHNKEGREGQRHPWLLATPIPPGKESHRPACQVSRHAANQ